MSDEVKSWKNKFYKNINNLESKVLFNKNNLILKKYYTENDNCHIYNITGNLKENPSFYMEYLWDINKMKKLNKNIIKEIKVLKEYEDFKETYSIFNFKSRNISIEGCDRKDVIFLEKTVEGYRFYNKICNNKTDSNFANNLIHIDNGYSFIELINKNNSTEINLLIEFNIDIPGLFELIPALLIFKSIINLANIDNL